MLAMTHNIIIIYRKGFYFQNSDGTDFDEVMDFEIFSEGDIIRRRCFNIRITDGDGLNAEVESFFVILQLDRLQPDIIINPNRTEVFINSTGN